MPTKTTLTEQISQSATAIGAYTRVVDSCTKVIKEGIPLPMEMKELAMEAWTGLAHEVKFLRFLREEALKE